MSNQLKTRNGIPFDFVDGLRIKGVDVTNWDKVFIDQGASYVGFQPVGNLAASNVQAAIAELESEKQSKSEPITTAINLRPGANQGVVWDIDAFGGGGDSASITLETAGGEATKMRFKMANDADDNFEFTAKTPDGLTAYNNAMTLNGNTILNSANLENYTAPPISDYTALRTYAGSATQVRVTGDNISGFFFYDAADVSSLDNGGTVIVASNGKRWKRIYSGNAYVNWFGADNKNGIDSTAAFQAALNAHATVELKEGNYTISSTITGTLFGQSLIGPGSLYAPAKINYTGSGTAFTFTAATNYVKFKGGIYISGTPLVSTDYYNAGSVAVDITAGAVSIEMSECWVSNFETVIKSNYNSFYNKFNRNRFEKFKTGLFNFSSNNLEFIENRISRFNRAILVNGNDGPTNVSNNSFEIFNGELVVSTGNEFPIVNFNGNYVEDYYDIDLPTNFPASSAPNTTKFGGGSLFTGYAFDTLDIRGNSFQIASILRITSTTLMRHYIQKNNQLRFAQAGNNLDRLASFGSTELRHLEISDTASFTGTLNAGFVRTYNQAAAPLPTVNIDDFHFFFDSFAGVTRHPSDRAVLLGGGIKFPVTQVPSADANTLDDYEEGVFTPVIVGTTLAGAGTYSTQLANYTKIGRSVFFNVELSWSAHTGTGEMRMNGLPFNGTGNIPVVVWYTTLTSPANTLVSGFISNGNQIIFDSITLSTGTAERLALDTSAVVRVSGHYSTAS